MIGVPRVAYRTKYCSVVFFSWQMQNYRPPFKSAYNTTRAVLSLLGEVVVVFRSVLGETAEQKVALSKNSSVTGICVMREVQCAFPAKRA